MTAFAWGSASDIGRVRAGNEDYVLSTGDLFVVADGMGGHKAGEVASHLAAESVRDLFPADFGERDTDDLVDAVQEANTILVTKAAEDPELRGMGTTLCALALVHDDGRDLLGAVNVGDSRLYLMKEGELEQITEDHSLVATLERQGRLSRAEAAVHPQRNILTRALGIDERVMVDSWEILPFVGDRYLLCSDGLFNEVDDGRIEATLRRLSDPGEAASELVRLANEGGGHDNVTCLVVDVIDDTGRDPSAAPVDNRVAGKVEGKDRVLAAAAVSRPGSDADDDQPPKKTRADRQRVLTWRVAVFGVALVAIILVALGSIVFAGTSTYYVGFDGDSVAIFRGKPGGVLWINPQLEERANLTRAQVGPAVAADLDSGVEQSTLDDARRYVQNLEDEAGVTTSSTPGGGPSPPASAVPSAPSSDVSVTPNTGE